MTLDNFLPSLNVNCSNGLEPLLHVPVRGHFRLWIKMPKSPFLSFQAFPISYFTHGLFAVSLPIRTTTHERYFMLSSIHFSIDAVPFFLTSSQSFGDTGLLSSSAPMLRICCT